ncbi:MAG: O-antigen ligase family protein [Candidatus Cloacimonetes bacterium]|jgi:hypothetical protein|nr:O-antigen ligase family protein [Candidatus Cloacimonadota bacterium]
MMTYILLIMFLGFIYITIRLFQSEVAFNLTRFNEFILYVLIFLRIISIYKVPFIPIAPDNIFYGFIFLIFVVFNKLYSAAFNKQIKVILLTYVFYQLLKMFTSYLEIGRTEILQWWILRDYFLLVSFVITINRQNFYKYLKWFTIVLSISMLFGLLIYFIGEPFASLRLKIINNPTMHYYGKGERVVGLNYSIFSFAYPLTILPILLLTIYKISSKHYLIILMVFSFLGLILNGERISLALASFVMLLLINRWFNAGRKIFLLIFLVLAIILFQSVMLSSDKNQDTIGAVSRIQSTTSDELSIRFYKQYAGLVTVFKHPLTGGTNNNFKNETYALYGGVGNYSHNAIINIGMYAGFGGWLLFMFFFSNILSQIKKMSLKSKIINQGVVFSFASLMGVSLFHNDGIFEGETVSLILLGFILGSSKYCNNKLNLNTRDD